MAVELMKLRLDKYLADMGIGTRTEVKKAITKGQVRVNEETVKRPEIKIDTEKDHVFYQGQMVAYAEYEYYMLNKPAGVVSATEDKNDSTVLDLIDEKQRKDLFPVGRLDKDTEGLLLITNDGELAVGKEVIYLKRLQMGSLVLDPRLALGEYRELTGQELEALRDCSLLR